MKKLSSVYLHFAAAFGTIMLILFSWSFVIRKSISMDIPVWLCILLACAVWGYIKADMVTINPSSRGDVHRQLAELEAKINQIKFEQSIISNDQNKKPY